jgi:GNAT superfamily N-acetyltransferase
MSSRELSPPQPISSEHHTASFSCTHDELNNWLKRRALSNSLTGASRTYVVCAGQAVVAYYALAAGSIATVSAPGRIRRNMPDPIPVIVLGRLAVDAKWAGKGLGSGLLKDALLRSLQASDLIGARALLCHAIDEAAKRFYLHHGFVESPGHPMTLLLPLR